MSFTGPSVNVVIIALMWLREMGNRGAIWMGMEESTKEVSDHMRESVGSFPRAGIELSLADSDRVFSGDDESH